MKLLIFDLTRLNKFTSNLNQLTNKKSWTKKIDSTVKSSATLTWRLDLTGISNIKKFGQIKWRNPNMYSKWNKSIKSSKELSRKESLVPSLPKSHVFPMKNFLFWTESTKQSQVHSERLALHKSINQLQFLHKKDFRITQFKLQSMDWHQGENQFLSH